MSFVSETVSSDVSKFRFCTYRTIRSARKARQQMRMAPRKISQVLTRGPLMNRSRLNMADKRCDWLGIRNWALILPAAIKKIAKESANQGARPIADPAEYEVMQHNRRLALVNQLQLDRKRMAAMEKMTPRRTPSSVDIWNQSMAKNSHIKLAIWGKVQASRWVRSGNWRIRRMYKGVKMTMAIMATRWKRISIAGWSCQYSTGSETILSSSAPKFEIQGRCSRRRRIHPNKQRRSSIVKVQT